MDLLTDESCRLVDNYERLNFIDEGTYGVVYRARDVHSGETYALKLLKCDRDKDGFPLSLLREISTLFSVRHRNVIGLREVVTTKGGNAFYLVLEYAEHDLGNMDVRFSESEVKSLMHQLLTGVSYLHEVHSIVHRDLKLCNLLLSKHGVLKIADFGLSRSLANVNPNPNAARLTPGCVTLWYRAPEILFASPSYSFAVDVWAIGCIFVELLFRKPLLNGKSELDQISKIVHLLGAPTTHNWPAFNSLPHAKRLNFASAPQHSSLRQTLLSLANEAKMPQPSPNTVDLICCMLQYDPLKRITARQALQHPYFHELPPPKHTSLIQTAAAHSNK